MLSEAEKQMESVLQRLREVADAIRELAPQEQRFAQEDVRWLHRRCISRYYGISVPEPSVDYAQMAYDTWKVKHNDWLKHVEKMRELTEEYTRLCSLHDYLAACINENRGECV